MGAIRYDIAAEQGASYAVEFRLMAGDQVLDLTGATARSQVREDEYSKDPLIDLSSITGGIVLDAHTGGVRLCFTGAQTALVRSAAKWDVFVYLPTGETIRVAHGSFDAAPTVTRP